MFLLQEMYMSLWTGAPPVCLWIVKQKPLETEKLLVILSFKLNTDAVLLCYQWFMPSCSNFKNTPSLHHSCCIKTPFFSVTTSSFLAIFGHLWFDSHSPLLSSRSPTRNSSHGHFPSHLFIFSTSSGPLGSCWLNSSITRCSWNSTNHAGAWVGQGRWWTQPCGSWWMRVCCKWFSLVFTRFTL